MSTDMSPPVVASRFQVAGIYATRWRYQRNDPESAGPVRVPSRRGAASGTPGQKNPVGGAGVTADTSDAGHEGHFFTGTRFEQFSEAFIDQLPRLAKPIVPKRNAIIQIDSGGITIDDAEVYLFSLPSDQVVAMLLLECSAQQSVRDHPQPLDRMLDVFTMDDFTLDRQRLADYLVEMAPADLVENFTDPYQKPRRLRGLERLSPKARRERRNPAKTPLLPDLPERHEVVFLHEAEVLEESLVEDLLYRTRARYQKEFTRREKGELLQALNYSDEGQAPPKQGFVTTRCSIIQGHSTLLEASVLLSTVQAVGTLARFRDIWDRAYSLVRNFRNNQQREGTGLQRRDDLEHLVDQLGNLEFDLTFSVEFPLMRIESFHDALSKVLDVSEQAERLSVMFTQISGSVRSELAAIDIRDSRRDEVRRQRNDTAAQWLAFIGVPVGVLLAFFGISTSDVDESIRHFRHYLVPYLGAVALGAVPILALALAQFVARRRVAKRRKQDQSTILGH